MVGVAPLRVGARQLLTAVLLASAVSLSGPARATDLEAPPVQYGKAPAHNLVSRLQERIDAGRVKLAFEPGRGYLRALLQELGMPESSQTLVFSKTSLQRHRIAPRTPRAVYFGDEAYVGFCQRGDVLEVTAVDPQLGSVFYTLDQKPADKPRFVRQNDNCLICHGSSANQGFPGQLVRSVFVQASGHPILSAGSHRVDHASPLEERWGGWYVSGTSGKQGHLGNLVIHGDDVPRPLDNSAGQNVLDLAKLCDLSPYLTPHSDIVALLVLEHQAEMHNLIGRATLETRLAIHYEEELGKAMGQPGYHSDSTASRIKSVGDALVKYLLFCGEAKLTDEVHGTSGFAEEFARRGPRDGKGRSLRDFDLERRLFKYPCSYLVYSAAFDAMPQLVKDHVLRRLWDVLSGKDTSKDFDHLSAADRLAILEILRETKPSLPEYWKAHAAR